MHSSEAQARKHPQRLPFIFGFKCRKNTPHFKNIPLLLASHSIPFSAFRHHPPLQQAPWLRASRKKSNIWAARGRSRPGVAQKDICWSTPGLAKSMTRTGLCLSHPPSALPPSLLQAPGALLQGSMPATGAKMPTSSWEGLPKGPSVAPSSFGRKSPGLLPYKVCH